MKVSLRDFIQKALQPNEIANIVRYPKELKQGVTIGDFASFNVEMVKRLMQVWCNRMDTLIRLDKEANQGNPTWKSHFASTWRGFTIVEYFDLFNIHIRTEDFSFYPVFAQFRKKQGGIVSAKQRAYYQSLLTQNEESYIQALMLAGLEPLLQIFFTEVVSYNARLPLRKILTHIYMAASTGSGKSQLIRVIFREMIEQFKHFSFVLIDPHGSLAESVKRLKSIGDKPENVVYIDPFLQDGFAPSFNPFAISDTSIKNITFTAEQIMSAIEEVLSREGGALTEVQMNMLENVLLAAKKGGNNARFGRTSKVRKLHFWRSSNL